MANVLGRRRGEGATVEFGRFLARDGSEGAAVGLDVERPHAAVVVGKRGFGKSYTLGVLAEGIAATAGVVGVVVDPMGAFGGLADGANARVVDRPRVAARALPARAWPALFDLNPASAVGSVLWRAGSAGEFQAVREQVGEADVPPAVRRAAGNYLDLAASWDVFAPDGLTARDVLDGGVTVLDCAGLGAAATSAIVRALADDLYATAVDDRDVSLPWLLVDEAHAVFDGVAAPALRTLLTRGRQPGVSLVLATQRPGALPDVAVSQADLLVAHRLTAAADLDALARARPTYLEGTLADRLPDRPGEAVVVDDAAETACTVRVRERRTPHYGESPRASGRTDSETRKAAPGGGRSDGDDSTARVGPS